MTNDRPLSIAQIVELLLKQGDHRTPEALRVHVTRAVKNGSIPGGFKANPTRQTSPWLVPAQNVHEWILG